MNRLSNPDRMRWSPRVQVSVSATCSVLVVPCCGLLYSDPIGEKPLTVMKLKPASLELVQGSGNPTARFVKPSLSGRTPADTRLNPSLVSFNARGDHVWVVVTIRFWPRRSTFDP